MMRVSWDGNDPGAVPGTVELDEGFVYVDGVSDIYMFPVSTAVVKVRPLVNCTNVAVTLIEARVNTF